MSPVEFIAWCIGSAVVGWTVGALLADPRAVLAPIWWALVDVLSWPARLLRKGGDS